MSFFRDLVFSVHSQNCKKWVLASSCMSACPSVQLCGTALLQLDGFLWSLIFWVFFKNLWTKFKFH